MDAKERSDLKSRVRNGAAQMADTYARFEKATDQLTGAIKDAKDAGLSGAEIHQAVSDATNGRPDRAKALENFASTMEKAELYRV